MDKTPSNLIFKLPEEVYYEEPTDKALEITQEMYVELFQNIVDEPVLLPVICGIHSGFPLCCILNFISGLFLFRTKMFGKKYYIFDDGDIGVVFPENGDDFRLDGFEFLPCPKCIDLFVHGELRLEKFNFKKCYCCAEFDMIKRCA